MYRKALVLEIKNKYVLAVEDDGGFIRLLRKEGLKPGDAVYFLPEDLYAKTVLSPAEPAEKSAGKQSGGRIIPFGARWLQTAGLAAVLILCLVLFVPQLSFTACAAVSIDSGDGSIQMELNEDGRILNISSPDDSLSGKSLSSLKGKHLNDAENDIRELCGGGSILLGYVPLDEKNSDSPNLISEIQNIFEDQTVILLSGQSEDLTAARKDHRSLGPYLADKYTDNHHMEKMMKDYSLHDLNRVLSENPRWMDNSDFRRILQETAEEKGKQKEASLPEPYSSDAPSGSQLPSAASVNSMPWNIPGTGAYRNDSASSGSQDSGGSGSRKYSSGYSGNSSANSRKSYSGNNSSSGNAPVQAGPKYPAENQSDSSADNNQTKTESGSSLNTENPDSSADYRETDGSGNTKQTNPSDPSSDNSSAGKNSSTGGNGSSTSSGSVSSAGSDSSADKNSRKSGTSGQSGQSTTSADTSSSSANTDGTSGQNAGTAADSGQQTAGGGQQTAGGGQQTAGGGQQTADGGQ